MSILLVRNYKELTFYMNKFIISTAAALAFCSIDLPSAGAQGLEISNGCIVSFLTIPASSECDDEDAEDVEYGFKLYELIKELFD